MPIFSIIIFLVIIGLLFWVIRTLSAAFSVPQQITTVLYVVLVVVCVLWLLQLLGVAGGGPMIVWR